MANLHIYELSIQSSYEDNVEIKATESQFDTVQWWVNNNQTWRIRTFDINSDIHVHEIKQAMTIDSIDELMKKRYSDILVGRYDFISISLHDNEIIINKMKSGSLETSSKNSFSFWNHDDRAYSTKTNPGNV